MSSNCILFWESKYFIYLRCCKHSFLFDNWYDNKILIDWDSEKQCVLDLGQQRWSRVNKTLCFPRSQSISVKWITWHDWPVHTAIRLLCTLCEGSQQTSQPWSNNFFMCIDFFFTMTRSLNTKIHRETEIKILSIETCWYGSVSF